MSQDIDETSIAITKGVRIEVRSRYVPARSLPSARRYAYEYTVRMRNDGAATVQLISRHWVLTDATGKISEHRGAGVVGEQPVLRRGQTFEYTSNAVLETPRGQMHGSFQMQTQNGRTFDALVAPFLLSLPYSLN
jgi:ApaG protein